MPSCLGAFWGAPVITALHNAPSTTRKPMSRSFFLTIFTSRAVEFYCARQPVGLASALPETLRILRCFPVRRKGAQKSRELSHPDGARSQNRQALWDR